MRKFFLIAKHEYLKMVRHKSFLYVTLGMPVLMAVVMGVAILTAVGSRGDLPVGYVDWAGVLDAQVMPLLEEDEEFVDFVPFANEVAADEALDAGQIQAYYIIQADYHVTAEVELVYLSKSPGEVVGYDFEEYLGANLMADLPEDVKLRMLEGNDVTMLAADGSREFGSDSFLNFIIPFAAAVGFVIAANSSAGYMLQAVTDEKENRTIEVLVTSVRPEYLIGGKALGLMLVSLSQLLIWGVAAILVLLIGAQFVPDLGAVEMPWMTFLIVGLFFLPAYALQAGVMIAIGAIVTDLQQGQQISGIMNLLFTMPLFFLTMIMAAPNSPFVVALSIFPTSAFITIVLRWAFVNVPVWQLVLSWIVVMVSAALSVWVAAKVFRAGMLRTGQRMSLKNVLAILRGAYQENGNA